MPYPFKDRVKLWKISRQHPRLKAQAVAYSDMHQSESAARAAMADLRPLPAALAAKAAEARAATAAARHAASGHDASCPKARSSEATEASADGAAVAAAAAPAVQQPLITDHVEAAEEVPAATDAAVAAAAAEEQQAALAASAALRAAAVELRTTLYKATLVATKSSDVALALHQIGELRAAGWQFAARVLTGRPPPTPMHCEAFRRAFASADASIRMLHEMEAYKEDSEEVGFYFKAYSNRSVEEDLREILDEETETELLAILNAISAESSSGFRSDSDISDEESIVDLPVEEPDAALSDSSADEDDAVTAAAAASPLDAAEPAAAAVPLRALLQLRAATLKLKVDATSYAHSRANSENIDPEVVEQEYEAVESGQEELLRAQEHFMDCIVQCEPVGKTLEQVQETSLEVLQALHYLTELQIPVRIMKMIEGLHQQLKEWFPFPSELAREEEQFRETAVEDVEITKNPIIPLLWHYESQALTLQALMLGFNDDTDNSACSPQRTKILVQVCKVASAAAAVNEKTTRSDYGKEAKLMPFAVYRLATWTDAQRAGEKALKWLESIGLLEALTDRIDDEVQTIERLTEFRIAPLKVGDTNILASPEVVSGWAAAAASEQCWLDLAQVGLTAASLHLKVAAVRCYQQSSPDARRMSALRTAKRDFLDCFRVLVEETYEWKEIEAGKVAELSEAILFAIESIHVSDRLGFPVDFLETIEILHEEFKRLLPYSYDNAQREANLQSTVEAEFRCSGNPGLSATWNWRAQALELEILALQSIANPTSLPDVIKIRDQAKKMKRAVIPIQNADFTRELIDGYRQLAAFQHAFYAELRARKSIIKVLKKSREAINKRYTSRYRSH